MTTDSQDIVLLEPYITRALGWPQAKVFKPSGHTQAPRLVRGQVNRVLTYRGCFNPPHQGHKDTLCHGFFRSGDDLNIIAAIVYFVNDKSVKSKYADSDDDVQTFVLTREQRIDLFDRSGLYGGWHWCYPRNIREQESFQAKLQSEAAKDGFQICFVTLTGADHVGCVGDDQYYPDNAITVGTGHRERTVFRAETETGFSRLPHYDDWQMYPLTESYIDRFGTDGSPEWLEQKLEMLFPEASHDLPNDPLYRHQTVTMRLRAAIWQLGAIRHCQHSTGPSGQWMRFVPTRFIGMEGGAWFLGHPEKQFNKPISSTRIRAILAEVDDKATMVKALSGVALSPELLFEYVQEHKRVARQKECLDSLQKSGAKKKKDERYAKQLRQAQPGSKE